MCFSMEWLKQLLILAVIVIAVIGILRALIPWALTKLGGIDLGPLPRIFEIVMWAVIIIAVIVIAFSLIECLFGLGSGNLLPFRR